MAFVFEEEAPSQPQPPKAPRFVFEEPEPPSFMERAASALPTLPSLEQIGQNIKSTFTAPRLTPETIKSHSPTHAPAAPKLNPQYAVDDLGNVTDTATGKNILYPESQPTVALPTPAIPTAPAVAPQPPPAVPQAPRLLAGIKQRLGSLIPAAPKSLDMPDMGANVPSAVKEPVPPLAGANRVRVEQEQAKGWKDRLSGLAQAAGNYFGAEPAHEFTPSGEDIARAAPGVAQGIGKGISVGGNALLSGAAQVLTPLLNTPAAQKMMPFPALTKWAAGVPPEEIAAQYGTEGGALNPIPEIVTDALQGIQAGAEKIVPGAGKLIQDTLMVAPFLGPEFRLAFTQGLKYARGRLFGDWGKVNVGPEAAAKLSSTEPLRDLSPEDAAAVDSIVRQSSDAHIQHALNVLAKNDPRYAIYTQEWQSRQAGGRPQQPPQTPSAAPGKPGGEQPPGPRGTLLPAPEEPVAPTAQARPPAPRPPAPAAPVSREPPPIPFEEPKPPPSIYAPPPPEEPPEAPSGGHWQTTRTGNQIWVNPEAQVASTQGAAERLARLVRGGSSNVFQNADVELAFDPLSSGRAKALGYVEGDKGAGFQITDKGYEYLKQKNAPIAPEAEAAPVEAPAETKPPEVPQPAEPKFTIESPVGGKVGEFTAPEAKAASKFEPQKSYDYEGPVSFNDFANQHPLLATKAMGEATPTEMAQVKKDYQGYLSQGREAAKAKVAERVKKAKEAKGFKEQPKAETPTEPMRTSPAEAKAPPPHEEPKTEAAIPKAPNVSPSDLSYDLAHRAHSGTSWVPEQRAKYEQKSYAEHMGRVWADLEKRAKTPEAKKGAEGEFERYRQNWLSKYSDLLSSKSRIVSAFVAGPSKFPSRTMEKRNNAYGNKLNDFVDWDKRAQNAMRETVDPTAPRAISADRADAVQALQAKIDAAKKQQNMMKAANAIVHNQKLSDADKVQQIVNKFTWKEGTAHRLLEKDFAGRTGFPDYELKNNSANIRRMEARIEGIKRVRAKSEGSGTFAGGKVEENAANNRVQVFFDEKPSSEMRDKLKAHGFHWSPTEGAWQRQRNENARYAVKQLLGVDLAEKPAKVVTESSAIEFKPPSVEEPSIESKELKKTEKKSEVFQDEGEEEPETAPPTTLGMPQIRAGVPDIPQSRSPLERNYQPPTGADKIKLQRRGDIIRNLQEGLQVPIRLGHVSERGARGIFKLKEEVVRTKAANDVEAVAHEVGHYLSKVFFGRKAARLPGARELKAMGEALYGARKPAGGYYEEGFAEFVRYYVTEPERATREAPTFAQYFQDRLDNDLTDLRDVLIQSRADWQRYQDQPAVAKILSQVSVGEPGPKSTWTLQGLYTKAIDDLHMLRVFEKRMNEGQPPLQASDSPYTLARVFRGWVGKADEFLRGKGPIDFDTYQPLPGVKPLGEILALFDKEGKLDDLRAYLVARSAADRMSRNQQTGLARADIRQTLDTFNSQPEFVRAAEELEKYEDALLLYGAKAGLWSKEALRRMKEAHPHHVPFYRLMDEGGGGGAAGTKKFANLANPIKRAKGSAREIIDPLESIVKNTYAFVNVADRNVIGQKIIELGKRPGMGKYIEKIPRSKIPVILREEEIRNLVRNLGIDDAEVADIPEEMIAAFRPDPRVPGNENILSVKFDGKPQLYQVHPDLYEAMAGLEQTSQNGLIKILSLPAQMLRIGATMYSPEFMIRNPVRDAWTAALYSHNGVIPLPGFDFTRGLMHILADDEIYHAWKAGGGEHSMLVSLDRGSIQKTLQEVIDSGKASNAAKFVLRHPIDAARALSEFGEEATRVGEFAGVVKAQGGLTKESIIKGGYAARTITLDFARSGAATKAWSLNRLSAFFNARVQGWDKMFREAHARPGLFLARHIALITIPSLLLWWANKDDPRYDELPSWRKDMAWNFPTGHMDNATWKRMTAVQKAEFNRTHPVFWIPKAFTNALLFGTAPERMLDWLYKNDPKALSGWLSSAGSEIPFPVPTAAIPLIENFGNWSGFRQRPVVSRNKEGVEPEYQYTDYTSGLAKAAGKAIGYSPAKIENLVQGWFGALGRLGLDATNLIFPKPTKGETPEKTLADIPIVRAFVARSPGQPESIQRFYDKLEQARQYKETWDSLKAENKPAEARKYFNDHRKDIADVARLEFTDEQLKNLRKQSDQIANDSKLSARVKRIRMDALTFRQIDLAKNAINRKTTTTNRAVNE